MIAVRLDLRIDQNHDFYFEAGAKIEPVCVHGDWERLSGLILRQSAQDARTLEVCSGIVTQLRSGELSRSVKRYGEKDYILLV